MFLESFASYTVIVTVLFSAVAPGAVPVISAVLPDSKLSSVLPALQGQVFDDSTWQVKIHDEGLPTKFHYKITYVG